MDEETRAKIVDIEARINEKRLRFAQIRADLKNMKVVFESHRNMLDKDDCETEALLDEFEAMHEEQELELRECEAELDELEEELENIKDGLENRSVEFRIC
jgi:predicted nuclease with TOPRIM domain